MHRFHDRLCRMADVRTVLLALPLAAIAPSLGSGDRVRAAGPSASAGFSSLGPAAQAQVSAALGRNDRSYHAFREGLAFQAGNRSHGLHAEFAPTGVEVWAGTARSGMTLRGYGYGDVLTPVDSTAPRATANRVEYRRGALTEWYVNGPLGLEQGFTLEGPPAPRGKAPLTLALALAGDLTASLDPGGDGLTLKQPDGQPALRYAGLVVYDADLLGNSVAVDGDTIVAGAFGDDTGAVIGTAWTDMTPTATLTASDGLARSRGTCGGASLEAWPETGGE